MFSRYFNLEHLSNMANSALLFSVLYQPMRNMNRQTVSRTVVRAEPDYDAQFDKLQKEAEDRLDDKVEELMKNIETVGQK